MNVFALTAYILVWPALTAVVLAVIVTAVIRDYRHAKHSGSEMV